MMAIKSSTLTGSYKTRNTLTVKKIRTKHAIELMLLMRPSNKPPTLYMQALHIINVFMYIVCSAIAITLQRKMYRIPKNI